MDITESRTASRRMRGVDPTASLSPSEGGKDSGSAGQQKQIVFRRRARRQTLSGVEAGYSTFTAGISLGWYAELGSLKFRQVRVCPLYPPQCPRSSEGIPVRD